MLLLLLACDPQTKPSDLPSESTPNESAPAQETDPADDSPAESKAHSDDSPHSEDPADTGPIFDDQVEILHITLGTYDNENAGTDERVTVCLNKTDCFVMDNADWNDNEQAAVDVYVTEGLSLSREALESVTVLINDGEDRWQPECVAVSFDGEPVHCHDGLSVLMGNESSELLEWADPTALSVDCLGCFEAPLTHGPIVGATGGDFSHIWLRTDATRRVQLRLATSAAGLNTAEPAATDWPLAEHDFTTTLRLDGLSPNTTYVYDLEIEGERYGPWSFTTAAAEGTPGKLRFGFGSCTKTDDQPIFDVIARYSPDLFLFVGDNHYGNTESIGGHRQHYRHAHSRPERAELMTGTPILATWDDHDFTGNNTEGDAPGKDVALRAFTEHWGNGAYGEASVPGVYSAHEVGDVLFVLLDDRYWRGVDGSFLGEDQSAWLIDTLVASDATFKFVVSGSQMTSEGTGDSWGSYPDSQAWLMEQVATIEGVVFLSGDIHRSELREVAAAPGGYDVPELTSSPLANDTATCKTSGELVTCYDDGPSFVMVEIDTTRADPTLDVSVLDIDGALVGSWSIKRSQLTP